MKRDNIQVGNILVTTWGEGVIVTKIAKIYFVVALPESRNYYADGKLKDVPQKKVYFKTGNRAWNLRTFTHIDNDYEWKLKKFKGLPFLTVKNVEENVIPTSLKKLSEGKLVI